MKTYFSISTLAALAAALPAHADVVTTWNITAGELLIQSRMGTPPAVRAMAIVQTAVHEAVADAQRLQASTDAAVAAANRTALLRLLPQQEADISAAYRKAMDKLGDAPAVLEGAAAGEHAARRVLAWRAGDGAAAKDVYRPHAASGQYVPTAPVATPQWGQRKPWLMSDGAQFRPGPPPALDSEAWMRDFNEVKALGGKTSSQRTPAQTEVAKFWEFSLPPIYFGVLRSVADAPGRSVVQNAKLFAAAAQAMDDGLIAIMDAKYHYGFWRPVTAVRNADRDGREDTALEAGWAPLIDTPMHPEYPSAHSVLAASLGEVLKADAGDKGLPELWTSSPTAHGATHRWTSVEAFTEEVSLARIWAGIHYRTSTQVGLAMGRRVGALAAQRVATAPADAGLPAGIAAGSAAKVLERISARGVQIYECRADAWQFVAPQATLFDASGRPIGTHDAGPHWLATDGSRVRGAVQAKVDATQAGAIPWLLLSANSVGPAGRFAGVTAIQRVNTLGGAAPQRSCAAAEAGQVEKVPYTADYLMLAS
ncbi:hypothetical protein J2X20_003068 [Pelomonas saccharophila]|uniref:Phosphatidic acid phosphatase type 2/haloperoxidase domain-containing protein n=1 Tax=Roseateles saccharophilus TaxID=304 RepID=A0ABU1YQC0_ROSSA|nr:DUF3455 domain-containing protein [Roseateles saccharophilus]MDR7270410.1 hypothetical protein [Roseateles saccharophilus]